MVVEIYTAQIGRYRGSDALDVSMQTRSQIGRIFTPPSWGRLMALKRGLITGRQFSVWYMTHLRRTRETHFAAWQAILERARVVLTCVCLPEAPCHRTTLARALVLEGGCFRGELLAQDPNLMLEFARIAPAAA